jgi:hypothetical protein
VFFYPSDGIIYFEGIKMKQEKVKVACLCWAGLKSVEYGKTVRRRCPQCKCRWKITAEKGKPIKREYISGPLDKATAIACKNSENLNPFW